MIRTGNRPGATAKATLALALFASVVGAQTPVTNNPPANPKPPAVPAGPVPGEIKAPGVMIIPSAPEAPVGVARPGTAAAQPPAEIKDKVESFKKARETFLARQRELAGANRQQLTEEQRQALLESIKANQQELRARIEEIKNEFRNRDIDTVIEDVKRNAGGGGRPRRGED